jgi:hypothetical protein
MTQKTDASSDPRVVAIREHPKVGRGTCTSIDECFGDSELAEFLDECDVKTVKAAVAFALDTEGLYLEQAANARWGEDDDPQLLALLDWHGEPRPVKPEPEPERTIEDLEQELREAEEHASELYGECRGDYTRLWMCQDHIAELERQIDRRKRATGWRPRPQVFRPVTVNDPEDIPF